MKRVLQAAIVLGTLAAALSSVPASAQDGRLSLSFTPGVATMSGDANLALAGTVDYRFSQHFSFEGDITWLDAPSDGFGDRLFGFDPRVSTGSVTTLLNTIGQSNGFGNRGGNNNRNPGVIFPAGLLNTIATLPATSTFLASTDGHTWIGTMGVRYEPTAQTARFRPYVSGGLGINVTDQDFNLAATSITQAVDQSISHSGIAFSAGGGANIHLGGALWAAADAKYFHLSRDRDVMRLGGGVTFKF